MKAFFYHTNDIPLKMNKTLTDEKEKEMKLLNYSDITNFDCLISDFSDYYNYVYIPQFNRYYFVTEIEIQHNNIISIHLVCDVLYTYKDLIKENDVYITKSAIPLGGNNVYNERENVILTTIPIDNPFLFKYSDVLITLRG